MTYYVYQREPESRDFWLHDTTTVTYLPLSKFEQMMDSYRDMGSWPKNIKNAPTTVTHEYPELLRIIEGRKENYLRSFEDYHYHYFTKAVEFINLFGAYEEGISVTAEYLKSFDFNEIPIQDLPHLADLTDEELTEKVHNITKYFVNATNLETNKIINVGANSEGDVMFLVMRHHNKDYVVMPFRNLDQAFATVAQELEEMDSV